jgi:guanylate kinase
MSSEPPVRERRGLMLVLSSPSGAGKTTISRLLLEKEPDLEMSVSVTTRQKRPNEVNGRDYHFIDQAAFDELVARDDLLEHARVFDHCYGTPRRPVEKALREGCDVLFDIDWQGAKQLRERAPDDLVGVFILPPSLAELERRLKQRAADPADVVQRRMAKAMEEISHYHEYDFVVVNADVERCLGDVRSILRSERLRLSRRTGIAPFVEGLTRTS